MGVLATDVENLIRRPASSPARDTVSARIDPSRTQRFTVEPPQPERRAAPAARREPEPVPARRPAEARRAAPEARPTDRANEPLPESRPSESRPSESRPAERESTDRATASASAAKPAAPGTAVTDPKSPAAIPPGAAVRPAADAAKITGPQAAAAAQAPVAAAAQVLAAQEANATEGSAGTEKTKDETDHSAEDPEKAGDTLATTSLVGLVVPPPPPPPSPPGPVPASSAAVATGGGTAAIVGDATGKLVASQPAALHGGNAKVDGTGDSTVEGKTETAAGFGGLLAGATAVSGDAALSPGALSPGIAAAAQPAAGGVATGAATDPAQAPNPTTAPPVPLGAVPMTIGLRSLAGSNHFEIRLDPKDLGRIDVNLDIDKERGTVTAHLVVDRPETLALLQRDAGSLQQALSQAGLDAGDSGINLSLRSETGAGGRNAADQGGDGRHPDAQGGGGHSETKATRIPVDAVPLRVLRGFGGIDIRI